MTEPWCLTIFEADPSGVLFSSTGRPQWVGESELDRARFRLYNSLTGRTKLGDNTVDESDLSALHNAIRACRDRRCIVHPDEWARDGEHCEGCLRGLDARDEAAREWDEVDA